MTWSLPSPDDRVEWSLWTSSNDTSSQAFKLEFRDMIQALGKHQYFTPYYQVLLLLPLLVGGVARLVMVLDTTTTSTNSRRGSVVWWIAHGTRYYYYQH